MQAYSVRMYGAACICMMFVYCCTECLTPVLRVPVQVPGTALWINKYKYIRSRMLSIPELYFGEYIRLPVVQHTVQVRPVNIC